MRVFVSDFDGTMTQQDFFKLAIDFLIPADTPNYWEQYRNGKITHFEALRLYFASIEGSEQDVLKVVSEMQLDPSLCESIAALKENGWRIIVASAGCDWYIKHLLENAHVKLEVHANPGRFEEGKGLVMQPPTASPYYSPTIGVDKSAIVASMLQQSECVAFAGDGFPDVDSALLVKPDLRFARRDLADVLSQQGQIYRGFSRWSDIANALLTSS